MTAAILAKERGGTPTGTPARPGTVITHYDAIITPRTPIGVDDRIHIYALIPARHSGAQGARNDTPAYTAYDTGIAGTILKIRVMEGSTVEFVVRNENEWSRTTYAYLAIQDIQDTTVRVDMWTRLWHAVTRSPLFSPIPETRRIPLENNAIIYRSRARPQSSDEPFRFTRLEYEESDDDEENVGGGRDAPGGNGHEGGESDGIDGDDLAEVLEGQRRNAGR